MITSYSVVFRRLSLLDGGLQPSADLYVHRSFNKERGAGSGFQLDAIASTLLPLPFSFIRRGVPGGRGEVSLNTQKKRPSLTSSKLPK